MREFFRLDGRRSGSLSHILSDPSVVHVLKASPLSPCTAMMLGILGGPGYALEGERGTALDILYYRIIASI